MRQKTATPLYNLRKARTLTQVDLANLARISQQSIAKAERGKLRLSPDTQERIAAILGVSRETCFPEAPAVPA